MQPQQSSTAPSARGASRDANRFVLHRSRSRPHPHCLLGAARHASRLRGLPAFDSNAPMLKMARAEYEPLYQAILARLDPRQVVEDLHWLANRTSRCCCWERPPFSETVWCHRWMVAAWLERELGLIVPEVELSPKPTDGVRN